MTRWLHSLDPTFAALCVMAVVLIGIIALVCYFLFDAHQADRAFKQQNKRPLSTLADYYGGKQ